MRTFRARKPLSDERIVELEEWFEDEKNAPVQIAHDSDVRLIYNRENTKFEVEVRGKVVSTHDTLKDGIRAWEQTPDPPPIKL